MDPSRIAQPPPEFGLRLVSELPRLRRHLAGRVTGKAKLDDVVQETVLRALESAHSFDEERALWPWIRTIAERSGGSQGRPRYEEPLTLEPTAAEPSSPGAGEELESLLAKLPAPETIPATFEALTLRTRRLPEPTLSTIEPGANAPFTWSVDGAVWSDDQPTPEED